jgi:hypothetical protein
MLLFARGQTKYLGESEVEELVVSDLNRFPHAVYHPQRGGSTGRTAQVSELSRNLQTALIGSIRYRNFN